MLLYPAEQQYNKIPEAEKLNPTPRGIPFIELYMNRLHSHPTKSMPLINESFSFEL